MVNVVSDGRSFLTYVHVLIHYRRCYLSQSRLAMAATALRETLTLETPR